jgi:hypothetical protein
MTDRGANMNVLKAVTAERLAEPAFSVVGVGAAEGGLDAFLQLLHALPSDTGMAFVLEQHLESIDVSTLDEAICAEPPDFQERKERLGWPFAASTPDAQPFRKRELLSQFESG